MKQLKGTDVPKFRKWILKKRQKGVCLICGTKPKTPCLDHHHTKRVKGTGQVRGVLCSPCNIFLAKVENNCVRYGIKMNELPAILRSTASYLEKKQYPYMHPSEKPKAKALKKNSIKKLVKLFKEKYPNRKIPDVTVFKKHKKGKKKGKEIEKKLTKGLERLYNEFSLEPEFLKRK